jgi:hypothetical protein
VREEHRLRVLGNRLLRKMPVPKRDEIAGVWRILLSAAKSFVIWTSRQILFG